MKVYECIIDDGKEVYKAQAVAKDETDLLRVYGGNGEFIKVTDISNTIIAPAHDYQAINEAGDRLYDVLSTAGYNDIEKTLICALLEDFLTNRK